MKKKVLFIVLGVILALVIGIVILFSFLNKEKKSMTADEFKNLMQEKGFIITDVTSQFLESGYVKKAYVASASDYAYQIEFYEISDVNNAIKFYNINKSIFESSKGNASGETTVSMKNYSKYTLSTGEKYEVISRIDNTAIYLDVESRQKDTVKDLLKELGY